MMEPAQKLSAIDARWDKGSQTLRIELKKSRSDVWKSNGYLAIGNLGN